MNSNFHSWKAGIALAVHTTNSTIDSSGHFHNTYSKIGDSLHKLKYKSDYSQLDFLANAFCSAINIWWATKNRNIDVIIPAPFSKLREIQPVYELAKLVSKKIGTPVDLDFIRKIKETEQLKSIQDLEERRSILKGAFSIRDSQIYRSKNILILDDLFRSGGTLNEISELLYREAAVKDVYIMTLTKTRVNK
ncbi:ComF family protein [Mannheimia sp. E15BD]|uniref:ComF family protein n=1 Tax=Mannheimia sp. E15BD TaxID=3278706 RepID=UPI00359EB31A